MSANWTAIVINYNGAGFIEACMQALQACTTRPAEILVVDNGSTDDSLLEMNAYPRAQVLAQNRNLGFAGGANVGLAAVETEFAVILNPDVEVQPDFGDVLLHAFEADARLAAAGPLLLYPDGEVIQHAGGRIERPLLTTSHYHYAQELKNVDLVARDVEFVTGGAMALRMTAVREAGGFDTLLSPVYYEDVDLCVRLRALHWAVRFIPELRALHHEGVTLQREPSYFHYLHRNRIQFALKHLSAQEWSESFVPAELERLRNELLHLQHADWMTVSGAGAVESLLRGPAQWSSASGLNAQPHDDFAAAIAETRAAWEVSGLPQRPERFSARVVNALANTLGLGKYMQAAFADQRAFNASVVRAFDAQERLQREQLATTLLIAVDLIGRLQQRPGPAINPGQHPER